MQPDPWAFGWTQALTLLGFAITGLIAWGGFRSFNRWKREQLEGRRIEIAFDLLAITYESKYVFDNIRSPMSFPYEWEDLPKRPGETEEQWRSRGSYYAVRKRVSEAKPFFDRVFQLQPKCMAIFGPQIEATFLLLHKSRREVEVASEMLASKDPNGPQPDPSAELWEQCRRDIWELGDYDKGKDKVKFKLTQFRVDVERLCRPITDREFGKRPRWNLFGITL